MDSSQEYFATLKSALANRADNSILIWWRDDDAVKHTHQLESMLEIRDKLDIPLILAVIPANMESSLVHTLGPIEAVNIVQHGFAHKNNAHEGEKKIELGGRVFKDQLMLELAQGQSILRQKFGGKLLPIMVPPWNRIEEAWLDDILNASSNRVLSTFGMAQQYTNRYHIAQCNCHIDVIDWKTKKSFVGISYCVEKILQYLSWHDGYDDRSVDVLGILTHHLVMDSAMWEGLSVLLALLLESGKVKIIGGADLVESALVLKQQ